MKCPYCGNNNTKVVDSRQINSGKTIRRRRSCGKCGSRFTTYEETVASSFMVVKRDGRRENFQRSKVVAGLTRACEKRPVSMAEIEEMTERIENRLEILGSSEINSDCIGEFVMDELRAKDQVAYIRFASVYRRFADVEKFAEEIDNLREERLRLKKHNGIIRIAVDGPSGAGKSTIAKKLAQKLNFDYIDTGAMYRAIAYKMIKNGVDKDDIEAIEKILESTDIDFSENRISLDGEDISDRIRTPEVSEAASEFAGILQVREKLAAIQREIGHRKSVVMDGRDIGTNIFPDAQIKFFLTATPEERAFRRFKELRLKGNNVDYDEILRDVKERDERDMTRELNPLRMADDAIKIDSTEMSIDEVVRSMYSETGVICS